MTNALLYTRVSHDEQVKFGASLEAQEKDLRKYCEENKYKIKGIYSDKGISGGSISKRKEFQRMIEDATAGDVVLFTKLDRFSRNLLDANVVVQELEKKNVSIKAINEDDIDTTTADGKFIFNLKLSLAQREREKTSERIKDVFEYKISIGEVVTGATPIGYKIENKHLVIDHERKDEVLFIFNTYDKTNSLTQTIKEYHREYNNNKCSKTITRILEDKIYIGQNRSNKAFCEPIVDTELFYRVQEKRKRNIRINTAKNVHLFTGLIHCPICGAKMNANRNHGITYYRCPNNKTHQRCSYGLTIREDAIEEMLIDRIKEFNNQKQEYIVKSKNTTDHSKELRNIDSKIERLKELYIDGDIDKDTYNARISRFKSEKARIEEIVALSNNEPKIADFKANNLDIYNELTRENKRSFWHMILSAVYMNETKTIRAIDYV